MDGRAGGGVEDGQVRVTGEIKVPRLAESISEAVVVAWLKPDGATVAVDEPIVTLETDKAAVEIPSEFTGVLRHARALGDRVEVGDVLARIEQGTGSEASAAPQPVVKPSATTDRPLSPAVRRMVEEHGGDPADITGSGPGGRGEGQRERQGLHLAPQ